MAEFVKTESPDAETCTVSASGEVDIATVEDLVAVGRTCLSSGPRRLLIELSGVTFIDSSGLGALVRIRNEAQASGIAVELIDVPAHLERLLEVTGLAVAFAASQDG